MGAAQRMKLVPHAHTALPARACRWEGVIGGGNSCRLVHVQARGWVRCTNDGCPSVVGLGSPQADRWTMQWLQKL